jgi:hypothetical protein
METAPGMWAGDQGRRMGGKRVRDANVPMSESVVALVAANVLDELQTHQDEDETNDVLDVARNALGGNSSSIEKVGKRRKGK